MKSIMDCHGIEVEEMGGSVRHEQVDLCPHKSWHLEGDCQLTEDHVEDYIDQAVELRNQEDDANDEEIREWAEHLTRVSIEADEIEQGQTKSTNPKDILARDEQRVLLHLIPSTGLIHTALAMMDGARKYGPYNWRDEGVGAGTYVSAAMRHLRDWLDGEEDAPDSGVHHLGHAAACILILLDAQAVGNLVDDRPAPAPTSEMMEEVKATGGVGGEEEDPAAGLAPYEPESSEMKMSTKTCEFGLKYEPLYGVVECERPAVAIWHLGGPNTLRTCVEHDREVCEDMKDLKYDPTDVWREVLT